MYTNILFLKEEFIVIPIGILKALGMALVGSKKLLSKLQFLITGNI